ncbi:MAG: type III toxin-antitoxin system ToxN/AbiQ family toxin [Clostridia bacterium]|nr:type III toxin-antitoxin system ToxN/AbiQ family toxin [Clostridia bacterium]
MDNKLKWYVVDKEYVSYLKKFDNKVENINYTERLKPYIGILITINEINYYVPISSVKEKHYQMNEDMDFIKIMENDRILGVLNLNNMIPIDNENVRILKYKEIDEYRKFKNDKEKHLYISFLSFELGLINDKIDKIKSNAVELYNEKINRPNSKISKRCCDFKLLEEKCREYK